MRARLLIVSAVPVMAAAGGCGGSGPNPGPGPDPSVLTTLEMIPATMALFSVSPGNSLILSAIPKDQNGETMTGLGSAAFSSQDEAVATVANDGTVTAVGVGSTQITASLTAGDVTEEATAGVTVEVAPAAAAVDAPAVQFQPSSVDVSAGGTVTWTFGAIHHDVRFTSASAPDDIPLLENGSESRTFPDNGVFEYFCSLHEGMAGFVRVH